MGLPSQRGKGASASVKQGRRWGSRYRLIGLMVGMATISVMVAIGVSSYERALIRSKESVLKNILFTLRTTIDEYSYDKKKAPHLLEDLVSEGYLHAVPIDPITGSDQTWVTVMEDPLKAIDPTQPGIRDVHSGSEQNSLEGTPYSQSPPW
jgi:general secretion pathway protein G